MSHNNQISASAGGPAAETLPAPGRAALRAGVVGNYIDNLHMFLPLVALPPALATLAGPERVDSMTSAAGIGAVIMVAMLLGRPIGGAVFGRISDRIGRVRTTRIALWGTLLCALGIAVLPTYAILGMGTIILLIFLRFLGGICIAGEYSAAIPLAMEWAEPPRRGLMSGLILSMAAWAQSSIAFVTAVLLAALGEHRYALWGWRLLFIVAALASLGMIVYYRTHVLDSPAFHRHQNRARAQQQAQVQAQAQSTEEQIPARTPQRQREHAMRDLLIGKLRGSFWQVFTLMTGLWFLTTATVLVLPGQILGSGRLSSQEVAVVMGVSSVGQAITMAFAGHLSTRFGRRRLFIAWGILALLVSPWLWLQAVYAHSMTTALLAATALQMSTVAAYGPVSAYLSERFPTQVRSTAYGMAYSWSLVIPALYPFYLPFGAAAHTLHGLIVGLLMLGALLLIIGAACGPALRTDVTDADIDEVARPVDAGRTVFRAS